MQAKQRVRFFQLADVFLASGLVPAYTAAAFIKKFARLALTASPAGAAISIAFIHNLLRRHPACNVLLNRPPAPGSAADPLAGPPPIDGEEAAEAEDVGIAEGEGAQAQTGNVASHSSGSEDEEDDAKTAGMVGEMNGHAHHSTNGHAGSPSVSEEQNVELAEKSAAAADEAVSTEQVASASSAVKIGEDVFREDEQDPSKSRALESSLWEVASLRNHYCPQVMNAPAQENTEHKLMGFQSYQCIIRLLRVGASRAWCISLIQTAVYTSRKV